MSITLLLVMVLQVRYQQVMNLIKLSESERVINPPSQLDILTFCVLVLKNGFTVTGESACASPENFDAEIGRKIARQNAVNKIWALEGYLLKQKIHDTEK
nr:Gp49 family protein [Providencia stuartii]